MHGSMTAEQAIKFVRESTTSGVHSVYDEHESFDTPETVRIRTCNHPGLIGDAIWPVYRDRAKAMEQVARLNAIK